MFGPLEANATATAFLPFKANINPLNPLLTLAASDAAKASLGANNASANVTVTASNNVQLVVNPDFYSSPNNWYCIQDNISCTWLPSDLLGSSGGVVEMAASATLISSYSGYAILFQPVETPNDTITSAVMSVRARLQTFSVGVDVSYSVLVGLYDPSQDATYAANITSYLGIDYRTLLIDFTGYVEPGRLYYVFVYLGVTAYSYRWFNWLDLRLYVDTVEFNVTTLHATFSNNVLYANVSSGKFYARLVLTASAGLEGLTANISLVNITGFESSPLRIVDGTVVSSSTGWLVLDAAGNVPGYTTGWVKAVIVKDSGTFSTLRLYLQACTQPGVCSFYPIELVIDPTHVPNGASSGLLKAKAVKIAPLPLQEAEPLRVKKA